MENLDNFKMYGTNVKISTLRYVTPVRQYLNSCYCQHIKSHTAAVFVRAKHLNRLGIVNWQQEGHCHVLLRDGQEKWSCTCKFHEGQAKGQLQPFLASALDGTEQSTALTLATSPPVLLGVCHSQSRHLGGTTNPSFLPESKPPDHAACRLDSTLTQLSQLTAY